MKQSQINIDSHRSDEQVDANDLEKQIRNLNEKLKKSEGLKSNFLSNVKNEIVNPLAGVLGLSGNLLIQNDEESVTSNKKQLLSLIHDELYALNFHLKTIFLAAEIEAGEVVITPTKVNLMEVVDDVLISLRHILNKRNVKVHISDQSLPSEVSIDRERTEILLHILIYYFLKQDGVYHDLKLELYKNKESINIQVNTITDDKPEKFQQKQLSGLNETVNDIQLSAADNLIEMLGGTFQLLYHQLKFRGFKVSLVEQPVLEEDEFENDSLIF